MEHIKLYFHFMKIAFTRMSEYRGSFLWTNISKGLHFVAQFLLLWIMITKFKTINGWLPYEVLMLYSLTFASYSIAGCFFMHPCTNLSERIKSGEFDEVLTKPINHFLYYFSREASFGYLSNISVAVLVLVICFIKLQIQLTLFKVLFLLVTVISGIFINGAFFVIGSIPAFWVMKSEDIMHVFISGIRSYTRYPITIYHKAIQVILTFIVPYAFINFFPAQYFLNKNDFSIFHPVCQFLSPIAAILSFSAAYFLWKIGINNYKSSGS